MPNKKDIVKSLLEIDAAGRSLGRVASEAAFHLRGKNSPAFTRHEEPTSKVKIINAAKLSLTTKKLKETKYANYSGYPGGLKFFSLEKVAKEHGYGELCRRAIYGMIPKNKLRPIIMKNLTITE